MRGFVDHVDLEGLDGPSEDFVSALQVDLSAITLHNTCILVDISCVLVLVAK